jgi:hypothetical protein
VVCHDPHTLVVQLRQAGEQTTRTECQNCHFQQAKFQDSAIHPNAAACIDCHMPHCQERLGRSREVHRRYPLAFDGHRPNPGRPVLRGR